MVNCQIWVLITKEQAVPFSRDALDEKKKQLWHQETWMYKITSVMIVILWKLFRQETPNY